MNPSVFNNSKLDTTIVYNKYVDALSNMGDKISNTYKFGITNKVDTLDFIKIKNLLLFIKTIDGNNYDNCVNDGKSDILNKFNDVIS